MAGRRLEKDLAHLSDLRAGGHTPEAQREIAAALGGASSVLVAKAARIAAEWKAVDLIPQLLDAFERFLAQPEVTDKGCTAKLEIVKALTSMEHASPEVFLKGIRHVQMEPTWGGSIDTAAELRGVSAIGLAQTAYPNLLTELTDLLV